MRKALGLAVFIAALLLSACQMIVVRVPPSLSADEVAIYSDALKGNWQESYPDKELVIFNETMYPPQAEARLKDKDILQDIPQLSQETLAAFRAANKRRQTLPELDSPVPHAMIDKATFDTMFDKASAKYPYDGWEKFYQAYPDALFFVAFSNIGFNEKMDQALLWVELDNSDGFTSVYSLYIKSENEWIHAAITLDSH